eukprot:7380229-Prymnesium_polylepis.1
MRMPLNAQQTVCSSSPIGVGLRMITMRPGIPRPCQATIKEEQPRAHNGKVEGIAQRIPPASCLGEVVVWLVALVPTFILRQAKAVVHILKPEDALLSVVAQAQPCLQLVTRSIATCRLLEVCPTRARLMESKHVQPSADPLQD